MGRDFEVVEILNIPATLSLSDSDSAGLLSVRFDRDASLRVGLSRQGFMFSSFGHSGPVSVNGSNGQNEVTIPKAWIAQSHFSVDSRSAPTVDLDLLAPEATIHWKKAMPTTISVAFFLNGMRFITQAGLPETVKLGDYDLEFSLIDDYVSLGKTIDSNWNAVTTVAEVKDISAEKFEQIKALVEDACWLLSFAFGAGIGCVRMDVFDSSSERLMSTLRRLGTNEKPFYSPLLLEQLKGELKHYLEAAFKPFQQMRDVYRLRNIIQVLLRVASQPVVSVEGLLLANVLEIIRHSFASNVLVPQGRAVLDGDQFRRPGRRGRLGFGEILDEFSAELGLSGWTPNRERFIDFRNKIIHEGELLGTSFEEQRKNVLDILHFCQCCVLALLEWDRSGGTYIPGNEDPNTVTETATQKSATRSIGVNLKKFTR